MLARSAGPGYWRTSMIASASAVTEWVWRLHSAGKQSCNSQTSRVKGDCLSLLLLLPMGLPTPNGNLAPRRISVSRLIQSVQALPLRKVEDAGGSFNCLIEVLQAIWNARSKLRSVSNPAALRAICELFEVFLN